jgi:integrase/recombinase XerD
MPLVAVLPANCDEAIPHLRSFVSALLWAEQGLAPTTQKAYAYDLSKAAEFLAPACLEAATEVQLREYLMEMYRRGVRSAAARRAVISLRRFFAWLQREGHRSDNPAASLELPKLPAPYPKALSPSSSTALLENARPQACERERLRDKALLEVSYGCGLRVSELLGLKLFQVDLTAGVIRVMGKGSKERMLPMGQPAAEALAAYLKLGRPQYVSPGKHSSRATPKGIAASTALAADHVFLNRLGKKLSPSGFWRHLQTLAQHAGVPTSLVSPHVLRHSYATDMLMGGADLRSIQSLLGHSSVNTTAVYLHEDKRHLRRLVAEHHPRG